MKNVLSVLLLMAITCPAYAQVASGITSMLGLQTQPNARNNITVMNMPQSCNPPQNLVGKSVYQIEGMRFNQPVRIIHPGEMITSDYDQSRIDIMLDQNGIIQNVHCG